MDEPTNAAAAAPEAGRQPRAARRGARVRLSTGGPLSGRRRRQARLARLMWDERAMHLPGPLLTPAPAPTVPSTPPKASSGAAIDLSDRPRLIRRPPVAAPPTLPTQPRPGQQPDAPFPSPRPGAAASTARQEIAELPSARTEAALIMMLSAVGLATAWAVGGPAPLWLILALPPLTGLAALLRPGGQRSRAVRAAVLLGTVAVLPSFAVALVPLTLATAVIAVTTLPRRLGDECAAAATAAATAALAVPLVSDLLRSGPAAFWWAVTDATAGPVTTVRLALACGLLVVPTIGTATILDRRARRLRRQAPARRATDARARTPRVRTDLAFTAADRTLLGDQLANEAGEQRGDQSGDQLRTGDAPTAAPGPTGLVAAGRLSEYAALLTELTHLLQAAGDAADARPGLAVIEVADFADVTAGCSPAMAAAAGREVGARLQAALPNGRSLIAVDRHRFALPVPFADAGTFAAISATVDRTVASPLRSLDRELTVTCRLGAAIASPDTEDPDQLILDATAALHAARRTGGPRYVVHDQAVTAYLQQQDTLAGCLREAVATQAVGTRFLPLLALGHDGEDDRVVGAEVQVHWRPPGLEEVTDQQLMATAADLGLAGALGELLMTQALDALVRWRQAALGVDQVWVNLDATQLRDQDLGRRLSALLSSRNLDGTCLVLEVAAADLTDEHAHRQLGRLRSLGVALVVDRFGAAGTALTGLHELPVSAVKLDEAFAADLVARAQIPQGIAQMCQGLGLRMIAQGVQSREQLDAARSIGVDAVQGPMVAPAVSAQDMITLLTLRRSTRSPSGSTSGGASTPLP